MFFHVLNKAAVCISAIKKEEMNQYHVHIGTYKATGIYGYVKDMYNTQKHFLPADTAFCFALT